MSVAFFYAPKNRTTPDKQSGVFQLYGEIRPIAIRRIKKSEDFKMESSKKIKVKFKLDKHRFVRLEVEAEKMPIVQENNREVSRNEKRELRHESLYSLEALTEDGRNDIPDERADTEEQVIKRESIVERNKRLFAALHKLSPRQQEIIRKVYFEEKTQRKAAVELGITESTLSLTLKRAIGKLKKLLEK